MNFLWNNAAFVFTCFPPAVVNIKGGRGRDV